MNALTPDIIDKLKTAAGNGGWIEDAEGKAPYLTDERDLYHGDTALVLRPNSTKAVAEIVLICNEAEIGLVPQGGNTGYCGGSIPEADGSQIVLSLSRLNQIRAIDPANNTMTVEAGCVLANIQAAAEDADRLFPLSLGAEGSCQIGGNLATNAGGVQVLRYGNARDLVLGLEVVLPNGRVLDGLRGLRKDNTGYDLKQLFLGAEGTLGIITAAVLKLYPRPRQVVTVFTALADVRAAVSLLARLRDNAEGVTAFEILNRACLDLVCGHIDGARDPFAEPHAWYALIEISANRDDGGVRDGLETVLGEAMEASEVEDAVIAASGQQAQDLWRLRETIPEAQKRAGGCIKHDISVPISRVADFIDRATHRSEADIDGVRVIAFGHIGDGNIHFNLTQPTGGDADAFQAHTETLCPAIHDIAVALGGSFSAEHGIGVLKKPELERYKSAVELDLMALVKGAIDPKNIMNPGKVVTGKTNTPEGAA
ncbi:MAG: FAD-binding oxidoreductase [Rhodospirillales bacterium]|nr:FAD-binding oxidoreductase [Rhodospirillales bacterium]